MHAVYRWPILKKYEKCRTLTIYSVYIYMVLANPTNMMIHLPESVDHPALSMVSFYGDHLGVWHTTAWHYWWSDSPLARLKTWKIIAYGDHLGLWPKTAYFCLSSGSSHIFACHLAAYFCLSSGILFIIWQHIFVCHLAAHIFLFVIWHFCLSSGSIFLLVSWHFCLSSGSSHIFVCHLAFLFVIWQLTYFCLSSGSIFLLVSWQLTSFLRN